MMSIHQGLSGGYCLGGTWHKDRTPKALTILYDPSMTAPPIPSPLLMGGCCFWGCPNYIGRLIFGIDQGIYEKIKITQSGPARRRS